MPTIMPIVCDVWVSAVAVARSAARATVSRLPMTGASFSPIPKPRRKSTPQSASQPGSSGQRHIQT